MDRRRDLDFAKGIGIILMILGHCYSAGNGSYILSWLYSFHMPLFFIIPGILYRQNKSHKEIHFWIIVKNKAKRLLIPYFFFSTISAIALSVIGRKTISDFAFYMQRILLLQGINTMWFIPCFFFAELTFLAFVRNNAKMHALVLFLLGFAAVCFPALVPIMPMLQTVTIGVAFLALGFLCAGIYNHAIPFSVWLGCVLVHLLLALFNHRVDLAYAVYGNPVLYFLNGLLGTFVMIHAYACLSTCRAGVFLAWIGRNSMVVLCTNSLVIEILRLLDYKITHSFLPKLGFAEGIILCMLTVLAEIVIIHVCNQFLWFITGTAHKTTSE